MKEEELRKMMQSGFEKLKPANKVEPKFHEGEWIISDTVNKDYHICKITGIKDGNYTIESIYGYKGYNQFDVFDNVYRLWTIQDAKDGDVLVMDNRSANCIFIYKLSNNGIINKYASYNKFGFEGEHYLVLNDGYVIPATKEQRDALEKIMADAGYTFDFEKKELKKIEQKSAESNDIKSVLLVHDEILNNLLERYKTSATFKTLIVNLQNWWNNTRRHLLSFNIEQKNAWSKEDEEMLLSAIEYVCTFSAYRNSVVDWLKSLKEKYTWKPSDEQMEALWNVYQGGKEQAELATLYTDLKKLRNE